MISYPVGTVSLSAADSSGTSRVDASRTTFPFLSVLLMTIASCGSILLAISDTRENTVRMSSTSPIVCNSSAELSKSPASSRARPRVPAGSSA